MLIVVRNIQENATETVKGILNLGEHDAVISCWGTAVVEMFFIGLICLIRINPADA
jgi:hypothetical protein